MNYEELTTITNVVGDLQRIKIIDMLSCSKMNASELLEKLNISQSTLSFHMKKLVDSHIVLFEKDQNKVYYYLNVELNEKYIESMHKLFEYKDNCVCMKGE